MTADSFFLICVLTLPFVKANMRLKSHSLCYYKSVHEEQMVPVYAQGMWCRRNSLALVINCVHVAVSCAVHEGRPADGDWLPQSIRSRQSPLWFYVRRLHSALWQTAPRVAPPSPYLPLSWPSVNICQVRGVEDGGEARWCWTLSCRAVCCLLFILQFSALLQWLFLALEETSTSWNRH